MIYFMSDIHGNAVAYFSLKMVKKMNQEDQIYILGNIFDGNSEHPEHCLAILDDIMKNDNITLILGNHEYMHLKYYLETEEVIKKQVERALIQMQPSGKPLLDYMRKLPKSRLDKYISYLRQCEMSALVTVENRKFYLVHGAPAKVNIWDGYEKWKEKVAFSKIDLEGTYQEEIAADPDISRSDRSDLGQSYDKLIIVCGNVTNESIIENVPKIKKEHSRDIYEEYQKVIFYKNKLLINCGCQGDEYVSKYIPTLACVSVNDKGYDTTYLDEIFDS